MLAPVTFTLDVEDYAPAGEAVRAPEITRRVLALLAEQSVRGTFFVVGSLAIDHPDLIHDIIAGGHELGLHGWRHEPLPAVGAAAFHEETARGKHELERISQTSVVGYRAPMFSLVAESRWAVDTITELGFEYSSSVLPARSPLFGDPGAPRHPFRWPSGLLELPCPVATFGRIANPYLGGVYFRVLPWPMIRYGLSQAAADEVLWLYCHPYDFDRDEPFRPRAELGRLMSRVMWVGRRSMARRVTKMLDGRAGAPLRERAACMTT